MTPLLMGLIGGAGQGLQTLNKQNYDEQVRAQEEAKQTRMMQMQHDLKIQEDQTVQVLHDASAKDAEQRAIANQAQVRQTTVGDINNQMPGLINQGMTSRFSGSDAAVAAANAGETDAPLTQEQQDTITQGKADAQSQLQTNPRLQAQAANNAGYYDVGANLLKQADANRVSAGWGTTVGQINPDGTVDTLIDNSTGRNNYTEGMVGTRQQTADAATARADAYIENLATKDPQLANYQKAADSARIHLDRIMTLAAANPSRPGQDNPYAPLQAQAQSAYESAVKARDDRVAEITARSPGGSPSTPPPAVNQLPVTPTTLPTDQAATINDAMKPPSKSSAPYPDGTVLSGPGGKRFIVKNGVPTPL